MDSLAEAIVDKSFSAKEMIQEKDESSSAALYIVREGSIVVSKDDGESFMTEGDIFGDDQLLADANGKADTLGKITLGYSIMSLTDSICGVLTLRECRLLFDTTERFTSQKKKAKEYNQKAFIANRRASMAARRSLSMDTAPVLSTSDFSKKFYDERKAIREFYKAMETPIENLPREKIRKLHYLVHLCCHMCV